MEDKPILAESTAIKTAFVEIKTLTIGKKQMTLAVFRQLPEEDVINQATCELRGIPWGHVNYHPDCKDEAAHLHVIWQKEQVIPRQGLEQTSSPARIRTQSL